jgi:hypothetical protein
MLKAQGCVSMMVTVAASTKATIATNLTTGSRRPARDGGGRPPRAATRAANNGATVATLEAIFGWEGGQMAALYTKAADRRKLSADHMEKPSKPETGTSIPSPSGQVRELG